MKTRAQEKFDFIVKEGLWLELKPLGFRKKANNFYKNLGETGQVINVQKSVYGSKDAVSFTLNIGVFEPKYWLCRYGNSKELPEFASEPECLIRKRIGELKGEEDTWYEVDENSDESALAAQMSSNLNEYILPFLAGLDSVQKISLAMQNSQNLAHAFTELIFFAEHGNFELAKERYERILQKGVNPLFKTTLEFYRKKYTL